MSPMPAINMARRFSLVGAFVHLGGSSFWWNWDAALHWLEDQRIFRWARGAFGILAPGWRCAARAVLPSTVHPVYPGGGPVGPVGLLEALAVVLVTMSLLFLSL